MNRFLFFTGLFAFTLGFEAHSQSDQAIQFIENKNQWRQEIDFGARIHGGNMFVQPGGFSYYFLDKQRLEELHQLSHFSKSKSSPESGEEVIQGSMIQVNFLGSNLAAEPSPLEKSVTYYNYFLGSDPCHWVSGANAFKGVYYPSFYRGVDLKLYSLGDAIKYDFIVSPGADPFQIQIEYNGADQILLSSGDVHVNTNLVSLIEKKPVAFQIVNGAKVLVKCEYSLEENIIGFRFPNGYDPCLELVIDPLLIFSTYSGSTADNWGSTATHGENGTLYSSGVTNPDVGGGAFPVTPGAFQTTYGHSYDVAVLKYDSVGHQLLYASYLGGINSESAHSLVMNSNQELLILGTTGSSNFPTTAGAFDQSYNGGSPESNVVPYNNGSDIFIAKISKDGTQLLASTFLGGTSNDGLNPSFGALTANYGDQLRGDIITDTQGNIFISTVTSSPDFPVSNSFNTVFKGGNTDALILKLNPSLSQITWGAFLGGGGDDASHTIKFDQTNNLFVAGGTTSGNFVTTSGAYQTAYAGSADGWIAHIQNDGSSIIASTLTGTSTFNQIYFLDLNSNDEVYVYGQTVGSFPVTPGVYSNANSGQFIQKFSNNLKNLLFSTVFGSGRGIPDISPTAFLVNDCNNLYMSGWGGFTNTGTGHWPGSSTNGMPVSADGFQKTTSGSDFYFMVLTDDASQFLYGTYLGGTQSKTHVDGGTSRFDKSGVVYHAVCSGCQFGNPAGRATSDFPITPLAWSATNNSFNCNNAAFKFDLSSLKARIQTNSLNLKSPGLNKVCIPDKIVFQNRSTGGQFYEWKFGDGHTLTKPDTSAIVYQYSAQGQYTVKLKAIDAGTCKGKDSTSTVINVYLAQGFAGPDLTICKDSPAQLTGTGGASYLWTDNTRSFQSAAASPIVSPKDTTRYYVAITDINGCIKKDTVLVKVVPGIEIDYEISKVNECLTRPKVKVVNRTDTTEHTFFDFGDGVTSSLVSDIHDYKVDGNYTIKVIGKKAGCVYEEAVTLPFFSLFIPNVITPGGSTGFNDFFRIKYGDRYISETEIEVSLLVYNRWGNKVYENKHYRDDWSAEGLPAGVYYYEVEIEGEVTCKNWIHVIK